MWTCEKCGLTIKKKVVLPVHHLCEGQYIQSQPVCTHRGPRLGQASCGCGAVYRCELLGGICSPRPPVDEWATVTIDGVKREIRDLDYRCCRGCAEFVTSRYT